MALGASSREVVALILRQSLGMVGAGVVLGGIASIAASSALEKAVAGMRPQPPSTFAAMFAVLVVAALAASFLPARRASRVDPVKALRQE
jgi:ABC-type antimicrobial peptide transport system permease subunit